MAAPKPAVMRGSLEGTLEAGLRFWVKLRSAKLCPISEGNYPWKPWFKRGFQMELYIYILYTLLSYSHYRVVIVTF